MSARSTSRVALGSLIALSAFALLALVPGLDAGLACLAPALLLALPLLHHRYIGEQRIAHLAGRRAAAPARHVPAVVRLNVRGPRALVPRSGSLIACSLASRPPPRTLLHAV